MGTTTGSYFMYVCSITFFFVALIASDGEIHLNQIRIEEDASGWANASEFFYENKK